MNLKNFGYMSILFLFIIFIISHLTFFKDNQLSNESPFKLDDRLSTFGAIQVAMMNGGLEAGFKKDLLLRVLGITDSNI